MTTSIRENPRRRGLRFAQMITRQTSTSVRVRTMHAAIIALLVAGVMAYAPPRNARSRSTEASPNCPQPGAKVDLAFIIDRSGSLDAKAQGQTYNVEIEGVRRAILDPSLIPRDASIAVAVFTFAGEPSLRVPFTEIKSESDAATVAATIEALKCVSAETCPQKGPNRESNAAPALLAANKHLSDNQRAGARRVFLVSTDGGFTDSDIALETASSRLREATAGIASEVDVILLGLLANPESSLDPCPPTDPVELDAAKTRIKRIVFPEPDNDLPGARLDISAGGCSCPNAVFGLDCERQVKDFVEHTRRVIRSQPATRFLTVTTDADTDPGTPVIDSKVSLRQAIERGNNGGATTITFDSSLKDKSIRPRVPLPALTAPDIRICGCNELNCDYLIDPAKKCDRSITIDGSQTDITKGEQHSDGIVIRSDRSVVRGLRIINFAGAGVSIEPVCNRGFSRIELNRFENNKKAGVRVLDLTASFGAAAHNVGNTISMNDILGSETPIDLGGDGPTPNDPGDLDEGPNTRLNFPERLGVADTLDVVVAASGVSLTGQVNGPTAAGATVEIFSITSFLQLQGGRVIDSVNFLKQATTDANGSFAVTGLPGSPTCGYTATVTDLAGNTSEMMFPCGGFPKAKVTNVNFLPEAAPNQLPPQTGTFDIENTGCAPLAVSFASIRRDGFPQRRPGQIVRSDDREHFEVQSIIIGSGGQTLTIQPGQTRTFTATFNPSIPRLFGADNAPASLVLPDIVNSTLTLQHNGCTGSDSTVSLTGHVARKIQLIDPDKPRSDPLITFGRSGDVFTVVFSIYDSNQDVGSVIYEFFDEAGGPVDLNQPERDLSRVVEQARANGLQIGQSFSIKQTFTNAKKHRNVASVTVTVSDKEGSTARATGSLTSSASAASVRSMREARGAMLMLPAVELETSSTRRVRRAGALTTPGTTRPLRTHVTRGESRAWSARSKPRERRIPND